MQNYYEILGVNNDAPLKEIELAYRSRVKGWTEDNREEQAEFVGAYITLRDSEKKKIYDAFLSTIQVTYDRKGKKKTVVGGEAIPVKDSDILSGLQQCLDGMNIVR